MGEVCPSAPNAVERRASANAFFSLFFVMTALPRVLERVPKWQKASAATPSTQLGAGSETLETSRTRCCKFLCSLGKTTQRLGRIVRFPALFVKWGVVNVQHSSVGTIPVSRRFLSRTLIKAPPQRRDSAAIARQRPGVTLE